MTEEREYLIRVAKIARDALRAWIDSGDSQIVPDVTVYQRFEEVAQVAETTAAMDAGGIEQLAGNWRLEWEKHKRALVRTQDVDLLPGESFWSLWFAIEDILTQTELTVIPAIETVAEFIEQKVPIKTICDVYGWHLPNGAPDAQKVSEERAKPGTHVPLGFMTPMQKRKHADNERKLGEARYWRTRLEQKLDIVGRIAPETVEQLAILGVSAKQIAKMKKISVEDVLAECDRVNIPRPPLDYSATMLTEGRFDREKDAEAKRLQDVQLQRVVAKRPGQQSERLADIQLGPADNAVQDDADEGDLTEEDAGGDVQAMSVADQVASLSAQGLSGRQIADETGVSYRRVLEMLKQTSADA